jgi:hypothetical protein
MERCRVTDREKIEFLEQFIAEVYWDDCGLCVWDDPKYANIKRNAQLRNANWTDKLSDDEKAMADRALRSVGALPRYSCPTIEDYEAQAGLQTA